MAKTVIFCDEQDEIGGTYWGTVECYQTMLCISQWSAECTLCTTWPEGDLPLLQITVMTENLALAASTPFKKKKSHCLRANLVYTQHLPGKLSS